MTAPRCVAVIGLGVIGGSLARDLAANGIRVIAHDTDAAALRAALDSGAVAAALDDGSAVAAADVVVIAVPLSVAVDVLAAVAGQAGPAALLTDVCSTKHTMTEAAARLGLAGRFIGGHPLAGDHRTGWAASRTGLFRGATVYLCPGDGVSAGRISGLRQLWEGVGAKPELIEAREHDRLLAWTSHLPQAASTGLARALAAAGIPLERLGPGGRDMTRLAHSSAAVWTPVALDNAPALGEALAVLEAELSALRGALGRGDREAVRRYFELQA